jgi:hypothetical protein
MGIRDVSIHLGMNKELFEVSSAVLKLQKSMLEGEIGSLECMMTAVYQLVNEPSHEPNLKNVLVAAIAFHNDYLPKDDQ